MPSSGLSSSLTELLPESQEVTSLTPSGIEISFQARPKRIYKVRRASCDGLDYGECKCKTTPDIDRSDCDQLRQTVPSVTTVLDMVDKSGPLIWWGQRVGVEGVLELFERGELHRPHGEPVIDRNDVLVDADDVVELLKQYKLTTNDVNKHAKTRGTAVHDVLEMWANGEKLPSLDLFPEEQKGYVKGLYDFLADVPSAEPVASEVMVGSVQHGFAGRYDIRFRTHEEHRVVYHRTPVRGPQYATLKPGLFLGDLKSGKGVYLGHSRQLAAYELASIECGYGATEAQGILHVGADGTYEFVRSVGQPEDFLCVLALWKSEKSMQGRRR